MLDPEVLGNRIECLFWIAVGIACLLAALRKRGPVRTDFLLAAPTFAVFGLSDAVESVTGAWWRPWWLLVWKGLCLMVLLGLYIRYLRRRRAGPGGKAAPPAAR